MTDPITLYPLLLKPILLVKVWGGRKLASVMNKPLPTEEPYGESWEIFDDSIIENGPLSGQRLGDVLTNYSEALIGPNNDSTQGFPLLVKFLDSATWLSIQVHPDDAQAARLEDEPRGKTEAWYVINAEPEAQLVIGVKPGTTREEMTQAIQDNNLEERLVYADITSGDALYIRAGTIHAVGPGAIIYEIQQSSDRTYRLYDWGRVGLDGKLRPLHIKKGVEVSNVDFLPEITQPGQESTANTQVVKGEYFTTMLHRINGTVVEFNTNEYRFHTLTCIEGTIQASTAETNITLATGQSAVIPASTGLYQLQGTGAVLRSWQTH
jgi:mannose-6-phosphate isomerase